MLSIALAPWQAATPAPSPPVAPHAYGQRPDVESLARLGRLAFFDASLSADGRLSCATCHDPRAAFGAAPGHASPFEDGQPAHRGTRAIPSLRYLQFMPRFTEHYVEDGDDDRGGEDAGPTGGLTWDGRADTAHEQARIPLFADNEMANADDAALGARIAAASWAPAFRQAVDPPGGDVFDDPRRAVAWLAYALEVFEQQPEFAPFSSKWDRVLAGKDKLDASEQRGYAIYVDPQRGNCEVCHPSGRMARGAAPLFTDGGFVAVAAPRAPGLPPATQQARAAPATAYTGLGMQPDEYDLGLCASGRRGLSADPSFCGRFRVPSLRNVAIRPTFFHNGSIHSLRDAVAFYATRDTQPERWYGRDAGGAVRRYDDLPAAFVPYVDHEVPFVPRGDGTARLSPQDIEDLVAYLRTLTDADVAPANGAQPDVAPANGAQADGAQAAR